jgi:hypothetical protein
LPYRTENYDGRTGQYSYTPIRGPLFTEVAGILVVIVLAMGLHKQSSEQHRGFWYPGADLGLEEEPADRIIAFVPQDTQN